MTNSGVVTVRGLRKAYGGRVVVEDLDLDVAAGEVVGLIGANGAGKTTTVECLQGLRRPDAGTVRVLGLDPQRDAERLRPMIGAQLQNSALPDRLRVGEADLSGGERQRLFLVLALLDDPQLVILDELTQGLDPAARREVWTAVRQLQETGTTVLLVTHELAEAEELCGRVVVLRSGRVLDTGTPAELVARHGAHATVRFSWSGDLDGLTELPGVREVTRFAGTVTVHGQRQVIAQVGAWLVPRGPVPTDLRVEVPDLEAALLALLDAAPAMTGAPRPAGAGS